MQMTAELSLYPLNEHFEQIVLSFIDRLLQEHAVSTATNSMSTQVSGESHILFDAIRDALEQSYQKFGQQVLVAKFIPEHHPEIGPLE
jgi:uncharacterized protein YqgV (UPF0045/DUF77 family)